MESLSRFSGTQVEWVQPKTFERSYELRAGEALLGTMSFRSAWGTLAVAEAAEGRWSFKRVGFLNPRVTIRVADGEEDLAVYQPRFWGDGVLSWPDGRSFAWQPLNFWATAWTFTDAAGQVVLGFTHGREKEKLSDIFKLQATVELQHVEPYREVLPILLPLGLYLMILREQDAAAATAAVGAAS